MKNQGHFMFAVSMIAFAVGSLGATLIMDHIFGGGNWTAAWAMFVLGLGSGLSVLAWLLSPRRRD